MGIRSVSYHCHSAHDTILRDIPNMVITICVVAVLSAHIMPINIKSDPHKFPIQYLFRDNLPNPRHNLNVLPHPLQCAERTTVSSDSSLPFR